jgi:hypothetical protein
MIENNDFEKTLNQFGFRKQGESGNNIYGMCPFCHAEKKFYANTKLTKWDCKKCGRDGGFYTFITMIAESCAGNKDKLEILSSNRSLKHGTLTRHDIGYNILNDTFTIPNYFYDNVDKVYNIGIFNYKKVMYTSGCNTGLFGWEQFTNKSFDTIWLCEGVWDWLAMDEILHDLKKKRDIAIGSPGANTFKADWGNFFKDKDVNIMYDNDDPGKTGAIKVHNILINYAKEIRHIHWLGKKDGYDLRDLYMEKGCNPISTIRSIRVFLNEVPPTITKNGKEVEVKDTKDKFEGKGIGYEKVYYAYKKWLHLPSVEMIDVLYGTIIANRLDGDPLWMFFVAPPGGTKTELLMTVSGCKAIETMSSLTPHTLVSGMTLEGGIDASLLPKLNNKVVIVKDFTTILNMNQTQRDEIFGILRDAYDGEFSKPFGNSQWKKYKSKFGLIAGVTYSIEKYLSEHTAMGERLLRYSMPIDDSIKGRKEYIRRAMGNVTMEVKMREELRKISSEALDFDYGDPPEIPEDLGEKIIGMSQLVCMLRGIVDRDKYTKEVLHSPFVEVGTRIAKQFCKLGYGIAMFKRKKVMTESEYDTLKAIAKSSVITKYERVFHALYKNKNTPLSTDEISEACNIPSRTTIEKVLQDFNMNKVSDKERQSVFTSKWVINDDIFVLAKECEFYKEDK